MNWQDKNEVCELIASTLEKEHERLLFKTVTPDLMPTIQLLAETFGSLARRFRRDIVEP